MATCPKCGVAIAYEGAKCGACVARERLRDPSHGSGPRSGDEPHAGGMCPKCRGRNKAGDRFCKHCGADTAVVPAFVCDHCGARVATGFPLCPTCLALARAASARARRARLGVALGIGAWVLLCLGGFVAAVVVEQQREAAREARAAEEQRRREAAQQAAAAQRQQEQAAAAASQRMVQERAAHERQQPGDNGQGTALVGYEVCDKRLVGSRGLLEVQVAVSPTATEAEVAALDRHLRQVYDVRPGGKGHCIFYLDSREAVPLRLASGADGRLRSAHCVAVNNRNAGFTYIPPGER